EALRVERLDRGGGAGDESVRVLVRLEVREHPVGERSAVAALRPADADPQPEEVLGAQGPRDGPQAVVTGEASTDPSLKPAGLEIAVVVYDQDRVRLDLEERRCGGYRAPRLVHVRVGREQRDPVSVDPNLGEPPVELAAPRAAVSAREL